MRRRLSILLINLMSDFDIPIDNPPNKHISSSSIQVPAASITRGRVFVTRKQDQEFRDSLLLPFICLLLADLRGDLYYQLKRQSSGVNCDPTYEKVIICAT